nr:ribosome maturation factor RimM [Kibdelosporangium sp. MJ126-NF4]CEL15500.1 16S rRNA processing protein RimM [Kibdelosporangium sp. MJ126-NF4]CTQ92098.1 16S rRNA processing protein RimM [Kibdelosporangium sp. MJ126-NF4]
MDVVVGRVAKAHGLRGELAVDVRTDSPEQRFAVGSVVAARLRDGTSTPLTLASTRTHGERLLVTFDEVPDRTAAESLRGALLLADTDTLLPTGDPDEFYDHELEGLAAVLTDGTAVGVVREIVHSAAGELLAVDMDGREVLVPFVREIVPEVDIAGRRVVLDPPEGLLD